MRFYAELLAKLGLSDANLPKQHERNGWPQLRSAFETAFLGKTRQEWCEIFNSSDACVAPVLQFSEAPDHPHNRARNSFMNVDGVTQPAPAPQFLGTPSGTPKPAPKRGEHGGDALRDWGLTTAAIARLRDQGLGFTGQI
jgi:alpha-methylacyl-CoA racemase